MYSPHLPTAVRPRRAWLPVAALLLAAAGQAAAQVPAKTAARPSATPHGGHAPRVALGSSAAFAPDGRLWLVGLDAQARLFVQTSADDGRQWDAPRPLATGDDRIAADGENRPKIAFGPAGQMVISYTQPLAKPYTGAIRMLRSSDGGARFSAPATVHADRQVITHRFESIAFDAQGTLHTLWIDKRDLEGARPGKPGSGTAYRGAAVYRNESRDGGASFGPDLKLADHSCECCRIALAPSPDGRLAAMWRHVFAPNQRDHAFALLGQPAAAEPVRASEDRWALDACPHHGPGLAPAAAGGYHALWFGERAGVAAVRYGRLAADGRPQGAVRALPDAQAEHADLASAGRNLAIVWRSFDGQRTRLEAWLSADDGATFRRQALAATAADNDHPRLARRGDHLFVLWRTAEGVRVEPLQP